MADDRNEDGLPAAVEVRPATAEDLDAILDCDDQGEEGRTGRRDFLRVSTGDGHCLVATRGHQVIGYVLTRPRAFFGRDFVDSLVVHPSCRRVGAGGALLRTAVETAGTPQVFTSTNQSNAAMHSLLASEGWILSGVLDGLDERDPELVYYIRRR